MLVGSGWTKRRGSDIDASCSATRRFEVGGVRAALRSRPTTASVGDRGHREGCRQVSEALEQTCRVSWVKGRCSVGVARLGHNQGHISLTLFVFGQILGVHLRAASVQPAGSLTGPPMFFDSAACRLPLAVVAETVH